jgi:hypothetical protein
MGQPLKPITIKAPGFLGVNTQDSPTDLPNGFASVAENCIIDKRGRIAARKGFTYSTTNGPTVLGTSVGIVGIHEFTSAAGATTTLSVGNSLIFKGTTTLVDDTPAGYTVSADNWKIVSFNDDAWFFQTGQEPLMWDSSASNVIKMSDHGSSSGTPIQGNEVLAAYGRLWTADISGDKTTVYWSDLLGGMIWNTGTSGSINLNKFWPEGADEVVALAAHNDRLIIFGKNSILVYNGAKSPSTMVLEDTIANIGCIGRDTVQNTGTDVIFCSANGVRSLARTIQEKSLPLKNLSKNVRDDIIIDIQANTGNIKSGYSPEEAFYTITFPTTERTYCFDMRTLLEDGSARATTWADITPLTYHRTPSGALYIGQELGIATYTSYLDHDSTYLMKFFTNDLDFELPSNLKFLKKVTITVIGDSNIEPVLKWAYDYSGSFTQQSFSLSTTASAEYGIAEYNTTAEYTTGIFINTPKINGTGSGNVLTVGVEATINGTEFSIQKLDIFATLGRIL